MVLYTCHCEFPVKVAKYLICLIAAISVEKTELIYTLEPGVLNETTSHTLIGFVLNFITNKWQTTLPNAY